MKIHETIVLKAKDRVKTRAESGKCCGARPKWMMHRQESRELTERSTTLFQLLPKIQPWLFNNVSEIAQLSEWKGMKQYEFCFAARIQPVRTIVSSSFLQCCLSSIENIWSRGNTLVFFLCSFHKGSWPPCHTNTTKREKDQKVRFLVSHRHHKVHKGWGFINYSLE
jgi:hypothetical protein